MYSTYFMQCRLCIDMAVQSYLYLVKQQVISLAPQAGGLLLPPDLYISGSRVAPKLNTPYLTSQDSKEWIGHT